MFNEDFDRMVFPRLSLEFRKKMSCRVKWFNELSKDEVFTQKTLAEFLVISSVMN